MAINSSLPQLTIPGLAILLGEDKTTIAKDINVNIEQEIDIDEMIDEIEEDRECK